MRFKMKISKSQLRRIIKEEKAKLIKENEGQKMQKYLAAFGVQRNTSLSEIDREQPPVDSGGLTAAQAAKINAEQDRLEDERILQEFISDLEELVMTALQNEVPERELSKQLVMLGRSLAPRK